MLSLAYIYFLVLVPFLHTPRPAKFVLGFLALGCAVTTTGVGLAILMGGEGPFGFTSGQWASVYVIVQLIGFWAFNAILTLYIVARRW